MALETIMDNLRDGYKQLQSGSMLHVDELMNERRDNEELRNQWFYTADGEIFFLAGKKKTPKLAITREGHNPVLKHIDDAFDELVSSGNYHPDAKEAQKSIRAKSTVTVDLTKLRLQEGSSEYSFLEVSTSKNEYTSLKHEEKKLVQRVYGKDEDFTANMKMLASAGISKTRIYVLNPGYVRKNAEKGPVGRASWLGSFGNYSYFDAIVRNVNSNYRLRGVRRASEATLESPVGRDAKKVVSPDFEQILEYSTPFVPEKLQEEYQTGLRKLFK